MYRIGILTTQSSMTWVKELEHDKPAKCEFTYITYESMNHLKELYEHNYCYFDGMIFSGEIPYFYIRNNVADLSKPIAFFDVTQKDLYKALCKVMYRNPAFSLDRCFIDFLFEENQYLGIKEWIPKTDFPYIFDRHIASYTTADVYEYVLKRNVSLWKEGKIDYTFTRLSNLPEMLKEYRIQPIIVNPSIKSMHDQIQSLTQEIDLQHLTSNQVVFGNISINNAERKTDREIEYCQIALSKAILDFEKQQNLSFIIHKNFLNYEIITAYSDLLGLTNHLQSCSLASFLSDTLPFAVRIGWGIGHSLQEARENALQANNQSCTTAGSYAFVMTKDSELIGPLGTDTCIAVPNQYDERIDQLAAEAGMSALQIQRIIAVMDKIQSNDVSADDVSTHLGITLRAASRILKKLEDIGAAKVFYNKQKKRKGRPKKIFRMELFGRFE